MLFERLLRFRIMNGLLMTPNCAETETLDVFCTLSIAASGELKVRLSVPPEPCLRSDVRYTIQR